jgi:hypothetical protein
VRNIRFGLSIDGMNPFGEIGNSHSTWPVILCIYNLPYWLCMKHKFIMMPLLISGPVQVGNDIDVYLQPLIDDLLVLWEKEGIRMWDEFQQQHFNLRAMLFATIQDMGLLLVVFQDKHLKAIKDAPGAWMKLVVYGWSIVRK